MASLQQPAYQPRFVEQMWSFSTFNFFWAKLPQKSLRASIPRDSFLILWAQKFETMTLQQALDSSTTISEYQNREHPLPAVFQGWLGLRLWPQGQHQSVWNSYGLLHTPIRQVCASPERLSRSTLTRAHMTHTTGSTGHLGISKDDPDLATYRTCDDQRWSNNDVSILGAADPGR